ncbi:MAG TPA: hypothetical protein VKS60_19380 [Stellaceae bacterium]|nr:hypothetical protein [Stellaceae bacterium]
MTGRRAFLALSGGAVLAAGLPAAAIATTPRLVVYDSRLAAGRRFAEQAARDGRRIFDIAGQDQRLWREARAGFGLSPGEGVTGITRWSDWVGIRFVLAERGLRVAAEEKVESETTGTVFVWTMA